MMMKKQFFRVKQLTDQRFFKAEKTEVLSDDLQEADHKVEHIRNACSNVGKKLGPLYSGQESKEKRLKKNNENILGQIMKDSGECDEGSLLSTILTNCGDIEKNLAEEALSHEDKVEELVVKPLNIMLGTEVPNIQKTKNKLAKLTLDMDSARARYHTAVKHGAANVTSIKEELEDAEQKVEQCRDALASEMFQLISHEADFAQVIVQYVKLQRAFHESALRFLEEKIPELENSINDSPTKPVYGFPLEEHLRVTGRKVAFPIELCVCALLELGMEEEGLFRIAASTSKVRRMRMSFNACCLDIQTALEYRDPHVIAGALKMYLRELPEPLMTYSLYEEWMAAARIQTSNEARLQALKQVVDKLPQANRDNLQYLIKFFSALSRNQVVNKMTPQNIAIVIAPNLIWNRGDESGMNMNMNSANIYNFIIDNMVSHADWFFPGDMEFYQTFTRDTLSNGMTSSTGSISGLQTQEWQSSSPVERSAISGHTRGSSGDGQLISLEPGNMKRTQSSSSLSDHSSPPQGSPKPTARRKAKPAPVPPPSKESASSHDKPEKPPRPSVGPVSSTLPRPSKKQPLDHDVRPAVVITAENVPLVTMEKQQKSSDNYVPVTKQNTDCLEHQSTKIPDSTHRRVNSSGVENVCLESVKSGKTTETFITAEQPQSVVPAVTAVTVTTSTTTKVSHVSDNNQPKNPIISSTLERKHPVRPMPIAAPRNTANIGVTTITVNKDIQNQSSENKSSESIPSKMSNESVKETEENSGQDGVMFRRQSDSGERVNKPAVPERPASLLRPQCSFRGSRHSADSDSSIGDKSNPESERPMLERTHMYSVDKQIPSIIQVGGDKEKTVAVPSNNNNNEPVSQRSPVGNRPLCESLSGKGQSQEKLDRPPRPENATTDPERGQHQSSHSRTMSEGNIDFDADKSVLKSPPPLTSPQDSVNPPGSPRLSNRPPRPHMPPPPPAIKVKKERTWESTDL